ncbi:hypothetical protein V1527DRAFT_499641 [Lipomyces starkeyi]
MNYRNRQHSEQLSAINSNENIIVRYSIRTQIIHRQEEQGTMDKCNCATRTRYLLPCSHHIQLGVPLQVAQVHPRWRIQGALPALTVPSQNLDSSAIADIKDIAVSVREKVAQEELEDSQHLPRLCNGQPIGQKGCDDVDPAERLDTFGRTCPIPVRETREGQSGFSASLPSASDASIQVEQLQDVDDSSTLEEMWTDILSTIEQVNGNDGSEHVK